MKKTTRYRELFERPGAHLLPVAWDCLSAKIFERLGFEAIGTTGFGLEATVLGTPDVGFLTLTESVTMARNIANSVDVPVSCDAESGFGNAISVTRTVREFEKAGAAGLFIEDQVHPPECPFIRKERRLVSIEEMVGKIKAALDARDDPDFVVVARTDAGPEEAIERGRAYGKAGADAILTQIFDFHFKTKEEMFSYLEKYPKLVRYPIRSNLSAKMGATVSDFEGWGYKELSIAPEGQRAAAKTIMDYYKDVKERGTAEGWDQRIMSRPDFFELVGIQRFMQLQQFLPHNEI